MSSISLSGKVLKITRVGLYGKVRTTIDFTAPGDPRYRYSFSPIEQTFRFNWATIDGDAKNCSTRCSLAKQVAEEITLSPATVTTIIDRLEGRGLVIRKRSDTDKRKVHLSLSDAGRSLLQDSPKPLQDHFIKRYQNLEEWEQSQLLSAVERIAVMMDADKIDAAPMLLVGKIQGDE